MSSILPLWAPILLSAVIVWVASSIVHMVIKWHNNDQIALPNESAVADALRGTPAQDYRIPYPTTPGDFRSAEFQERVKRGPMAVITIMEGDMMTAFKKALLLWFVYLVVVAFVAGHVAHAMLGPGAEYSEVFHTVGLTAYAALGLGIVQQSIWWGKPWKPTIKSMVDALLYASLMAGTFGWLWPKM
ncbi:MAG TPA: hypothetical protein VJR92_10770 [Gemmatimonadaceae bacterium]|nr:hypothetical protein [Gemmatimonadaceae bacterium]